MSSTRTARTLALSALVGLFALSGCSFHYSSGSSSSRVASGGSGRGKPVQHSSHSSGKGKPTQKSGGSGKPTQRDGGKTISKGDDQVDPDGDIPKADEPATRKKPESAAEREKSGAERKKPAAQRTKPTTTDPASPVIPAHGVDDTVRAKTKTTDPGGNDTLVAPQ